MFKIIVKASRHLHDSGYSGVELHLPASKYELIDALDRARVPYGSGEYVLMPCEEGCPSYIADAMENTSEPLSLAEVNHLAGRLNQMEDHQRLTLEGVAGQHPYYRIADLINATHNLDKYSFYPGFTTDRQLGEHAMDNDVFPELTALSESAQACIDLNLVGARLREDEGGILTQHGYVVPEVLEWDIVYDGLYSEMEITLDQRDPIISLELCRYEDDRESIWLHCPASQEDMDRVLEAAHAESFDDCIIRRVQSVIPALEYEIEFDQYISAVNGLAADIKAIGPENYAKYKAAYEMEGVGDLDHARQLARELDSYEFAPAPTMAEYGRILLEKTGMDVALAAKYGFDFDGFVSHKMEEQNSRQTCYGFLTPISKQEQKLEPEQKIEPTLGGM